MTFICSHLRLKCPVQLVIKLFFQVAIGSSVFTLDLSSLKSDGSATPGGDYSLVAAIFGTFGAIMLIAVILAVVIAVLIRNRSLRRMKIHIDPRDNLFMSVKAKEQV